MPTPGTCASFWAMRVSTKSCTAGSGRLAEVTASVRIGVPTNAFTDVAEPPVMAAVDAALKVLEGRGATIVRLTLPLMSAISAYVAVISRAEAAAIHGQWMRERAQDYAVHLSARLYGGYAIPAAYYVEALARRGPILKAFAAEVRTRAFPSADNTYPMFEDEAEATKKTKMTGS